jgi:hypothetical protein
MKEGQDEGGVMKTLYNAIKGLSPDPLIIGTASFGTAAVLLVAYVIWRNIKG